MTKTVDDRKKRRSLIVNPNENVVNGRWNPTPVEFEAYLSREVEMARKNIAMLRAPNVNDTLHSARTFLLAGLESSLLTRKEGTP